MQKNSPHAQKDVPAYLLNSHDFLNFIKRSSKNADYDKKAMLPPGIVMNRNNSVFTVNDRKHEQTEKLAASLNSPSCQLNPKKREKDAEPSTNHKNEDLLQKKNMQIKQSMNREKQSMSDIVYSYSNFRSMEHNYYCRDKTKKKEVKTYEPIKFPQLAKNQQDIFTIEYDVAGQKIIKVNPIQLKRQVDKKKSSSLFIERAMREIKLMGLDKESIKKQFKLFKRRQAENQLAIDIKSINNRLVENKADYQNGLKLRKEIYEFVPGMEDKTRKKLNELKIQTDERLCANNEMEQSQEEDSQQQFFRKKQLGELQNYLYTINEDTLKLSSSIYQIPEEKTAEDYIQLRLKNTEAIGKRQNIRKSLVLLNPDKELTVYDQKIFSYREFLFMMNLAHRKFDHLTLKEAGTFKNEDKYKYYMGRGNNSLLVKSLMKRRFWWTQEDDYKQANFVWTQLKINNYYQFQMKSDFYNLEWKINNQPGGKEGKKKGKTSNDQKPTQKGGYKAPLPYNNDKIFTHTDKQSYEYFELNLTNQSNQRLQHFPNRLKYFEADLLTPCTEDKTSQRLHNHFQFNYFIGNKKALYYNLKQYYDLLKKNVFSILPLTFHIKTGTTDPEYAKFMKEFKKIENANRHQIKNQKDNTKKLKNIWIVKPGEQTNRGNGIFVMDELYQLNNHLKKKEKHSDGTAKTFIIQKYLETPLLYKGRKFDIRHYMMISRLHGIMRAYWYGEGYVRTSSFDFDLEDVGDQMIHLTNDAIQKNSPSYGKHEEGNKLSYSELQKYMDSKFGEGKCSLSEHIYPKMKAIATDAVKATYLQLDPSNMEHNFQVFGLDFMIDENLDVWLIEVNTNPCLEISSKLLGRIIPTMLEHAFRLTLDVIYPPPTHYPNSQKYLAPDNPLGRLMFQLIFDEARDGKELVQLYKNSKKIDYGGELQEDNETYENEGKQIELAPDLQ